MKFETEIPKQTWVTLPKPCRLQSPETEKSNMATRQPFRKWGNWISIGSYSYTQVLGHWSFVFIFKAKLKLESGNQKIQYGHQADILKLTSLKINRLLPIYISTVPLKFGLDIQSQTKVKVRKQSYHLSYVKKKTRHERCFLISLRTFRGSNGVRSCVGNLMLMLRSLQL